MPEAHDVHGGLVPPVKHRHHQNVPQLVAGAQVVELTWGGRRGEGRGGGATAEGKRVFKAKTEAGSVQPRCIFPRFRI